MKNQLILIFGLSIISCKSDLNKVEFHGFAEQDTIFLYQDGNGHFVANKLVENLKSDEVLSARMSISTSNFPVARETVLNKDNFYLRDTLHYDFRSGVSQIDTLSETFDTPLQYYSFYGGLDVYYANGDSISFLDTVTFVRINP